MPQMSSAFFYLSLGVATLAVSWASILIRLADADPISTAFYRMALASLLLIPFATRGLFRSLKNLPAVDRRLLVLSGIFLGFHFASWIASLKYTTISNSVVIVSTQPFFVAAMEAIFWKDKISRKTMVGMILALGGMVIISGSDFQMGGDYLWGDLLALIGAFCAACYLMVGRRLRQTLANRYYILPVYAVAAATLLVITVPTGAPLTGFSTSTWIYFALLALVPTMMGHSLYNYLLKFIRPHLVGITILGEPIGATVFAALLFKEYPPPTTYLGGAMILGGILLALSKITSEVKSGKTA